MAEEEVVLITQLPSDSWFEGFVVRPNGDILATRLDQSEIYSISPEEEEPKLLCTLPKHNSLTNIGPIPGFHDEYYVLAGTADLETVTSTDVWLWRLALDGDDASPALKRVVEVPEEGYCLGVLPISERIVLLPDAVNGCIWRLNTATGDKDVFAYDESMRAASEEAFFGVNRIKLAGDFLYYTNTSTGSISRIPIAFEPDEPDVGIRTAGPAQMVAKDLPGHLDGLAISEDQTHAYVASHLDGHLHKVTIDADTGRGTSEVILGSLDRPTGLNIATPLLPNGAAAAAAAATAGGKSKLYIICCGEIEVAWMVESKEDPWKAFRELSSVAHVSVTEEVVEQRVYS